MRMGGYGSGRSSYSFRTTVDECRVLDVAEFNREGFLDEAYAFAGPGTSTWRRDGEEVASIGWERTSTSSNRPALRLFYTVRPDTDDPREIDYLVPLEYTECHFGGRRPWFECPGEGCGERVGKLYKPPRGDLFLCRHCYDLAYESRQRSGEFHFENITKPFQRQQEAIEDLEDGPLTREKLREIYDATQAVRKGLVVLCERDPLNIRDDPVARGRIAEPLPPFEQWLDELFQASGGHPHGRPYGWHGRCEATAKSTGERCRQPATGEHGKCYYHGGAPDTGAPEGNQNAAADAD